MDGHNSRIQELLLRYAQGQLNREEFDELFDWLHRVDDEHAPVFDEVWNAPPGTGKSVADPEALFDQIRNDPRYRGTRPNRLLRKLRPIAAVAAACVLAGSIAFYFYQGGRDTTPPTVTAHAPALELEPGGNKATLEWVGGALELDDVPTGIAMHEEGVSYGDGGELGNGVNNEIRRSETLVLRVPRGGQYRIMLEDGTVAWLNAGSSLRYPAKFGEESRDVVLDGEGYFEVVKDLSRPFSVQCGDARVTVLGTRFNVRAYADDRQMVTTVVAGSVRVAHAGQQVVVGRNQAATVDAAGGAPIGVKQVNAEIATAWTTGLFMFDRDPIPDVMKRIGRWYDADIVLQGNLEGRTLGGTVSRYESVEKLLEVLVLTGHFDYRIEGRRIVVME